MKKILLLLLFFSSSTFAETANLIQAYQQALGSDALFQQAISQRLSDKENLPISIAALLPNAGVTVSPTINNTTASGSANLNGNSSQRGYNVLLNITQTVFDFGKFAIVSGASATSKQADATLNAAAQSLMLRVAEAYFNVLQDEDNLRLIQATKAAYAKQLDQADQQYKVGLKTITDVYTARASYDGAVAGTIAAENALANDKENLRVITGTLYTHLYTLSEKFPLISPQPANIDSWAQTAQQQNWSIKAAQYAARVAQQNIKQQRAGHFPTLNVQGAYNINYTRSTVTGGDDLVTESGTDQTHEKSVTLNLGIPLVQGGLILANTRQAQYQYQVATQQLEQQLRTTLNTTRQSYLGVIAGISKISADKQLIKSAVSSLEGMQAGYQAGTQTLVDVLTQQQAVFQAQKQYASDRYAYVNNLLALKAAAGTLSQEDLAGINSWLELDRKSPPLKKGD